jgi:L-lactate dehydrogenase complex protein LldE
MIRRMLRVSLFVPCLMNSLLPRAAEACALVLSRLGCKVDYPPDQTCCGQPAFNSGLWEEARQVARHCVKAFQASDAVVLPSGSCASMIRNHYSTLFADNPRELEEAKRLAARTYEFSEFIVHRLKKVDVGAAFPIKVTYHDSCHLNRELRINSEPRALLRAVKGLELIEMNEPDRCCGFGGSFSIKFPEISVAMARRKLQSIKESGAGAVTAGDPGCLVHLMGAAHRAGDNIKVLHLAEILAGR